MTTVAGRRRAGHEISRLSYPVDSSIRTDSHSLVEVLQQVVLDLLLQLAEDVELPRLFFSISTSRVMILLMFEMPSIASRTLPRRSITFCRLVIACWAAFMSRFLLTSRSLKARYASSARGKSSQPRLVERVADLVVDAVDHLEADAVGLQFLEDAAVVVEHLGRPRRSISSPCRRPRRCRPSSGSAVSARHPSRSADR